MTRTTAGRTFAADAISTSLTQVVQIVLALGASIVIARSLGPEGRGSYAVALLLPTLLVAATGLGLGANVVYQIARQDFPRGVVLSYALLSPAVLGAAAVLIGVATVWGAGGMLFPGIDRWLLLLGVLFAVPLHLVGFGSVLLVGLQRFGAYNAVHLVRGLAFGIGVVLLLHVLSLGVSELLLLEIAASTAAGLALFAAAVRQIGRPSLRLDAAYLKASFGYGLPIYLGTIASLVHSSTAIFLINQFLAPSVVGLYAVSAGLFQRVSYLTSGTVTVLMPRVSSMSDPGELRRFTPLVFRTVMAVVVAASLVLGIFGPWLITTVYSDAFEGSVHPFRVLLIGAFPLAGWTVLQADLNGRGRPLLGTLTMVPSLILNIALSSLWIPRVGIDGAAWASSVSYSLAFLAMLAAYISVSRNSLAGVFVPGRDDWALYRQLPGFVASTLRLRQPSRSP